MPKKDPKLKELAEAVKDSLEEEDFGSYREVFLSMLGEGFEELTDKRQAGKVKHLLSDCVGIILFCVFSEIDEWVEMELFANDNIDTLRKYLALPNGIPSHDTLERTLAIIAADELQGILVDVLRETIQKASQSQSDLYENQELDLRNCVVTADALNTQKETVKAIVEHAHADYCLAVKANQKLLYDDLCLYFKDDDQLKQIKDQGQYLREAEKGSGRITVWEHYITGETGWFSEKEQWKKLKSFGYVRKTIRDMKSGKETREERYYICSFKPDVKLFGLVIRRHWHIENLLHWVLDVVFKEDSLRTKEKKALHNLGLIKRFVLSILKILKPYYNNMSYRYMRRKIGRDLEKEIPVVFAVLKKMYGMGENGH